MKPKKLNHCQVCHQNVCSCQKEKPLIDKGDVNKAKKGHTPMRYWPTGQEKDKGPKI